MHNLNLNDTELENLFALLSVHSTQSAFDTYDVYAKAIKILEATKTRDEMIAIENNNYAARSTLRILDNRLIEFEKPAPEPDPTNPFVDYLIDAIKEDAAADWEEVDENTFQLFIDDKMVTVKVSEPEVYP